MGTLYSRLRIYSSSNKENLLCRLIIVAKISYGSSRITFRIRKILLSHSNSNSNNNYSKISPRFRIIQKIFKFNNNKCSNSKI